MDFRLSRARRALRLFRARVAPNWAFFSILAAALVLPAALFGTLAWQERATLLRDGEHVAIRTANSISEHAEKVLETHSLVLEQIAQQISDRSWTDIENDPRLRRTLSALASKLPQISSIWLVDSEGRMRQFGIPAGVAPPAALSSVSQLDYFVAHKGDSGEGPFVSAPFDSRSGPADTRQFSVSVRRSTSDGGFDGVISVAVSVSFFTEFWKQVAPPFKHIIPLIRDDGTMLVRYPSHPHAGKLPSSGPFMQQIALAPAGGFYTAVSTVDGIERMNAYLPVGKYPVYVSFSTERSALLAPWRTRAMLYALAALLTTLALCSVAFMAVRKAAAERLAARTAAQRAMASAAELRRRRELEAELLQSQKMEAVGQLTGGVAHDFNNLLHVMSLNVQLAEHLDPNDRMSKCLDNIKRSVDRAAQLTRQLTAFSRRQRLEPRSFAPLALMVRMADLLERTLGGKIHFDIDASPKVQNVYADPGQTELALLNLAVNARDAMPDGGRLSIRLRDVSLKDGRSQLAGGEYIEFAVTDTGTGMPSDVLARAFEPFFTTKDVGRGTGLGLSMVHGFASQSGGSVSISSRLGHGTTVSLLLPKGAEEAARVVLPTEEAQVGATKSRLGGRVLLVDDDSLVRASMLVSLTEAGYEVQEAASGSAALEILGRSRPDVVVTDFAMPGVTGLQLAEIARSMHPGMPIILVTGYAEPGVAAQAANIVDHAMHKPFRHEELVAKIDELLWKETPAGLPHRPDLPGALLQP